MIYKGYEIAKMLTKGEIPEDTLLTVTSKDKPNEINEIYIVSEGALWDIKEVDGKITKNYETGNSMLTCDDIYFRILKRCENCNEIIENDEIYHKYHGNCCGQCEKKSIDKICNKLRIEYSPTITLDLSVREDFFKDMTDYDVQKINTLLKNNKLRFY